MAGVAKDWVPSPLPHMPRFIHISSGAILSRSRTQEAVWASGEGGGGSRLGPGGLGWLVCTPQDTGIPPAPQPSRVADGCARWNGV